MIQLTAPYSFLEGEIAIFYSNPDGTPLRDPNTSEILAPIGQCHASVEISESTTPKEPTCANWSQNTPNKKHSQLTATISSQTYAYNDRGNNIISQLHPSSEYILVIRTYDKLHGNWKLIQLHHAHLNDQKSASDISSDNDSFSLRASHLESFAGNTNQAALPPLTPQLMATVEWCHQGKTIPCFHYNPTSETWQESPLNAFIPTGEAESQRYCYVGPDANNPTQAIIKYLTLNTTEATSAGNDLPRTGLTFTETLALTIGNHLNPSHHGLKTAVGHTLQLLGCPEPISSHPSASHWPHPLLRFRFLGRIYATISHGIIAIPSITTATITTPPPLDPPIWIAPNGTLNPETGHTGLLLLPHTGILDGITT